MADSVFLAPGGSVEVPINYSYLHGREGLGAPSGVGVASDNTDAVTAVLRADGMAVLISGVAVGAAKVTLKGAGLSDEIDVTVGEPALIGLALLSSHAVYTPAPAPKAAAPSPPAKPVA